MSDTPIPAPVDPPTEAQVYAQYEALLDTLHAQVFTTADPDALQALGTAIQTLTDLLDDEDAVHLEASTALFAGLTPKMQAANKTLQTTKDQIAGIAAKFADAAKVMDDIAGVLIFTAKLPGL